MSEPEFEVELLEEPELSEVLADLPSDQYYIRNKEEFVGRNRFEDRSLLPKKVHCPTDGGQELWSLERLPNGHYKISTRIHDPTAEIKGLLYALLTDKEKAEEWIIKKRGRQGELSRIVYTIQKADGEGWVRQEELGVADPQVAVRHLRATKSLPPPSQFEAGALWNIQPLVG